MLDCLFGVLRRFQHCTGHITTGSWKGRGNQYIEFARVVYCKLPTNGKQLPAFPLKAVTGIEPPTSEVRGESVTTLPPWPLLHVRNVRLIKSLFRYLVGKGINIYPRYPSLEINVCSRQFVTLIYIIYIQITYTSILKVTLNIFNFSISLWLPLSCADEVLKILCCWYVLLAW